MSDELLPCPWGHPAEVHEIDRKHGGFSYTVHCNGQQACFLAYNSPLYATEKEAIVAWNHRAPLAAPSRDPLREAAEGLKALLPQMREDVECHRSWTTAAAKADIEKIGARWVGDVEWHEKWAAYYGKVAAAMEGAIEQLERAALAPRSEGET